LLATLQKTRPNDKPVLEPCSHSGRRRGPDRARRGMLRGGKRTPEADGSDEAERRAGGGPDSFWRAPVATGPRSATHRRPDRARGGMRWSAAHAPGAGGSDGPEGRAWRAPDSFSHARFHRRPTSRRNAKIFNENGLLQTSVFFEGGYNQTMHKGSGEAVRHEPQALERVHEGVAREWVRKRRMELGRGKGSE